MRSTAVEGPPPDAELNPQPETIPDPRPAAEATVSIINAALTVHYQNYADNLVGYARRLGAQNPEDVVQDVFCAAASSQSLLEHPLAYLRTAVRNNLFYLLSRERELPMSDEDGEMLMDAIMQRRTEPPSTEESALNHADLASVLETCTTPISTQGRQAKTKTLTRNQQRALLLACLEVSPSGIAQELGLPTAGAASALLCRARKRLALMRERTTEAEVRQERRTALDETTARIVGRIARATAQ